MKTFFKKIPRSLIWILVLIVIVGSVIFVTRSKGNDIPTEIYTVEQRDVIEEVVIAGSIDSVSRVDLSFNVSGRVETIRVEEGDEVQAGDSIATLDADELEAELRNAQAELASVRADADVTTVDIDAALQQLEKTKKEQDTRVQNAYRALLNNDLRVYAEDPSDEAEAPLVSGTYTGAEGVYTLSAYNSASDSGYSYRFSGLERGTGTVYVDAPGRLGTQGLFLTFSEESVYTDTDWTLPIPNTRSSTYQQVLNTYNEAVATRDRVVADAEDDYDRLRAQEETTTTRTPKAQARLLQAEARVDAIRAQISERVLRAPFAGVVASLDLEVGEIVGQNDVVATLVNDKGYEMIVEVPEIDVAKLSVGDPVEVILDAFQDTDITWEGHITHIDVINTDIDGVPVYETTVAIDNPDARIRVGMSARARIITERKDNVIAIPGYFVVEEQGNTYVYFEAGEEGQSRSEALTLGLRGSDGFVEVIEGISLGDTLVHELRSE